MLWTVFLFANLSVLPAWLGMILFPGSKLTRQLVSSPYCILPAVLCYLVLGAVALPKVLPLFAPTLGSLIAVTGTAEGTAVVWVHMLVMDCIAGRWVYLDSQDKRLLWWVRAGALLFTFLSGPIGAMAYLLLTGRAGTRQSTRSPARP